MNEEKAKKLAELLAESPMADELKEAIIENLAKIPVGLIENLIISLEEEHKKTEDIASSIKEFFKKQDGDWAKLETKQHKSAEDIITKEVENIEQEAIKKDIENKRE